MRRFALAIIAALLIFSASGVSALVASEPCTGYQRQGQDDGTCPPTCVTCGCCAHAVEPAVLSVAVSPDDPLTEIAPLVPRLPGSRPGDILHVPKLRLA